MADSTEAAEAYEKVLIANLQRTIDFLKFAETKNAALLALSSAWVVATINLECSGKTIPDILAVSVILASLFSLCAALLALISFMPKLHLPGFLGGKKAGPHAPNLLFFGDISALTAKSFETEIRTRYLPEGKMPREEYLHDLTVQINVNSQITMRKMRLFRRGIWFIAAGGIVLLPPIIVMVVRTARGIWQI